MRNWGYVFIVFLWIGACQNKSREQTAQLTGPYFDLAGYITNYISDSSSRVVTKTITLDEKRESRVIQDYPLWKDIHDFDSYDINRPALYDKYTIDTVPGASGYQLTYQPIDTTKDLKVTHLQVNVQNNQVSSIHIKTTTKSFLEKVSLDIYWQPETGYTIERRSDKLLSKKVEKQKIELTINS